MSDLGLVFVTVFLAELGDKTQIAALVWAARDEARPLTVFLAASAALILSTAIAVGLGTLAREHLQAIPLKLVSGLVFLALGAWSIVDHVRAS